MRHALFLGLLLAGCPRQQEQPLVKPAVPDTDWCREAEIRLEALACETPRGDPMWVNRRGERFAETCRVTQEEGGVYLNPKCIAQVKACSEVDACAQRP